ncbi:zinc-dependent alcohol dehydrogenase family protein (plasmid) [Caballeronia sp. NK8]|uniref:zinc-dependent alcohol dehydrogenase family protein n=1 Tax=Caballeronia sp. NK8 TaxID=140098 RepID=UPI001BB6D022|nr:zinc-dependent alcohol dehydrogenase family protein [Caballeronia sp. NK8]BCQ28987.1 zinc-dependent alcohol dehydrogenase family protein [Caballeronia sp. NK8]
MRAMIYDGTAARLRAAVVEEPVAGPGQLLIDVTVCGVCRTDLHIIHGELPHPKRPVIPGHEVIGRVTAVSPGVHEFFSVGDRVGVPWLGHTCGDCSYCVDERENLCDAPGFTGYTLDGGYAERMVADSHFCLHLPQRYSDVEAAPLLCAGLIGFRTLRMAGRARRIGIYGFGAAAHIVAQLARHQGRTIYAFTRPGDTAAQQLALHLGADWAGSSVERAPDELDAALIFAPAGELVPLALRAVCKGGVVVCGGIHMSDIPSFLYSLLWGERRVVSVANLTRADGVEFMQLAADIPLRLQTQIYSLAEANEALTDLRKGHVVGAAVLRVAG